MLGTVRVLFEPFRQHRGIRAQAFLCVLTLRRCNDLRSKEPRFDRRSDSFAALVIG